MELSDVNVKQEQLSLNVEGNCKAVRYSFKSSRDAAYEDKYNTVFAEFRIDDLIDQVVEDQYKKICHQKDFNFYGSGWQSWGFGGEVEKGKKEKRYIPVFPAWKQYIDFPGTAPSSVCGKRSSSKALLNGDFVIYFRWDNVYLAVASTARVSKKVCGILPPVHFYADPKNRCVACTVYSEGKKWGNGEDIAELTIFSATDFFTLRSVMQKLYAEDKNQRFGSLQFLNAGKNKILTGGWESWYNHYADINQTLISQDLNSLDKTENLIKKEFKDKNYPCVFQVDDGWEQGLGQWECNTQRFPDGMVKLASSISEYGYIPGLWIAPFIIDWRTDFAKAHRDWILKDSKNKPVAAGMAFLWGDKSGKNQPSYPWSYFCLDLSRDDVLEYLDGVMEKAINEWGFRYLKLDFLFAGMIYGKYANGGCGYQWYDRAIKVLTKRKVNNKGLPVAYLGCGLPFEASFNDFPLSRIGPDTKEAWDSKDMKMINWSGRPGAVVSMYSALGHAFWDQGVFINDPDVVFLRYENISLTDLEKETLALVNYLFASQIMHSDDPVHFDSQKEGSFTAHISSLYKRFENEEFGMVNVTGDTYIIFSKSGNYTGFINLSDKVAKVSAQKLLSAVNKNEGNLMSVVDHSVLNGNFYNVQPHAVCIWSL